jgi:hypothetical protein
VRLEARAHVALSCADLYATAADLRNLPAWWIEHLSAEVVSPAPRLRDAVYAVRYRMWAGYAVSATCRVVAARPARSLTYTWEGAGMRLAVGQEFVPDGAVGCSTRLIADLHVGRVLTPMSWLVLRLMRRRLAEELERALATLSELAAARSVLRRSGSARGVARAGG